MTVNEQGRLQDDVEAARGEAWDRLDESPWSGHERLWTESKVRAGEYVVTFRRAGPDGRVDVDYLVRRLGKIWEALVITTERDDGGGLRLRYERAELGESKRALYDRLREVTFR